MQEDGKIVYVNVLLLSLKDTVICKRLFSKDVVRRVGVNAGKYGRFLHI